MPQPATFSPTTVATMPPKRAHSAGVSPWRILLGAPNRAGALVSGMDDLPGINHRASLGVIATRSQ